jgi:CDP-glucose 4,6-dehydratase
VEGVVSAPNRAARGLLRQFLAGTRVLLTGHTGFKGSWLALWLAGMGAKVTGLSLPAEEISLFRQARIEEVVTHIEGDIRDPAQVDAAFAAADPEVVFHLAAQPLVRLSYETPVETYATNVQGTVHVLDACRRARALGVDGLKAIVCITSDKAYENREWVWPYRERPHGRSRSLFQQQGRGRTGHRLVPAQLFRRRGPAFAGQRAGGQCHRRGRLGTGPTGP